MGYLLILAVCAVQMAVGTWLGLKLAKNPVQKKTSLKIAFIYLLGCGAALAFACAFPRPPRRYASDAFAQNLREYIIAPSVFLLFLAPGGASATVALLIRDGQWGWPILAGVVMVPVTVVLSLVQGCLVAGACL